VLGDEDDRAPEVRVEQRRRGDEELSTERGHARILPTSGNDLNMTRPVLLVDAENVRRSTWPNIAPPDLERGAAAWADREGVDVEVVWEGERSADDELVDRAAALAAEGRAVWVATSDRELRRRLEPHVERLIGGGAFARDLPRTR
jgi:hypothetical protein